jgi:hypothetical protein
MRKLSRMEASKEVRRILIRHQIDLSLAQYSVSGYEIRITGWLVKNDTSAFNASGVENLIEDFQRRLPNYFISGDMDNWKFTITYITYLGDPKSGKDEKETILLNQDPTDIDYGNNK